MSYFKKICLYTCIILLISSLYNDFTKNTTDKIDQSLHKEVIMKDGIHVVQVKINAGDTLLSISERINGTNISISMDQLIEDFKMVNPEVNTLILTTGSYYFFPVYHM